MEQYIHEEKFAQAIEKLKMYYKEESLLFDSMTKLLATLSQDYISDNADDFHTVDNELLTKFRMIKERQLYAISSMEKALFGYQETKVKVENKLKDMM